ncbi:MAG: EAL domain-containing protein [Lachnospiraceae bacterium]
MEEMPLMIILEENKMDSAMLRHLFENEYRVLEFQSTEETVQRLEDREPVDVILWNMILDFQNKVNLLAYLLSDEQYKDTTFIAIVGYEDEYRITTAIEFGAMEVITKPFRLELVYQRVHNCTHYKKLMNHNAQMEHFPGKKDMRKGSREIDALTGIYNAPAFYRRTRKMLDENPQKEFAMIYGNIDCFKVINDLFGRTVGDEVLRTLARKNKELMNGHGTYGRIAADDFVCCCPSEFLDEKMLDKACGFLFRALDVEYQVNIHMGVYLIEQKNEKQPVSQMCDRARMAAETVKGKYGKHYAYYNDSLRQKMLEEQMIIRDLDQALEQHQFFIQIQPIYDVNTKTIASGEALVRWRHPVKGIIPPFKFIPVFEKNGMISRVDYYVWEEACKTVAEMKKQGRSVPISVNVSRINLSNPHLCEDILALLDKYHLTTKDIKLEITESAYTENPDQLMEAVRKLKEGTFDILMDDFGSGYSSLNMLKDLPVDILKVDMRFMDEAQMSEKTINVVTSIVRMAKWIKMVVVAEGVETQEQSQFLESIGCDRIQGYLYSKPLDVEAFMEKVQKEEPVYHDPSYEHEYDRVDMDKIMGSLPIDLRMFIEMMVGVVGVFSEIEGEYHVMRVNDAYYDLVRDTPYALFHDKKDVFQGMSDEERKELAQVCKKAEKERNVEIFTFLYKGKEKEVPKEMVIKYVGEIYGKKSFYFGIRHIMGQVE